MHLEAPRVAEGIIEIWTDGAALPTNPGPGGWAYIVRLGDRQREGQGSVKGPVSNIQMEMEAVVRALRSLKKHDLPVVVYSDLEMISRGMNEWRETWIARGWRNAAGKPVANRDRWEAISELASRCRMGVTFRWVRGHSGEKLNERVDELANSAAAKAALERLTLPV